MSDQRPWEFWLIFGAPMLDWGITSVAEGPHYSHSLALFDPSHPRELYVFGTCYHQNRQWFVESSTPIGRPTVLQSSAASFEDCADVMLIAQMDLGMFVPPRLDKSMEDDAKQSAFVEIAKDVIEHFWQELFLPFIYGHLPTMVDPS